MFRCKQQFGLALLALAWPGPVMAADLPAAVYTKAPAVAPWSWAGFYVGGNVGYGWAGDSTTFSDTTTTTAAEFVTFSGAPCIPGVGGCPAFPAGFPPGPVAGVGGGDANVNGVLGGLQAGYNWQTGPYVLGFEADAQITGQKGSVTVCDTIACGVGTSITATASYKMPWFATFRGRVGWAAAPRWLLYVTGGLAVGRFDTTDTFAVTGAPAVLAVSTSTTRAGWALGGGVEGALDRDWSVKLEYLYIDYGSIGATLAGVTGGATLVDFPAPRFTTVTTLTTTGTWSTHVTDNIIRVGLNYHIPPR